MPQLNFDTLTIICEKVSHSEARSDLPSLAQTCSSWRRAAVPWLYRTIGLNFSPYQRRQLESFRQLVFCQDSVYRIFVRHLQIQGSDDGLLARYLDFLAPNLHQYLPNISSFSWTFRANTPHRFFAALESHCNLTTLQLCIYPHLPTDQDYVEALNSSCKSLSLMICRSSESEKFSSVSESFYSILSIWDLYPALWNEKQKGLGVSMESLVLSSYSIRQWKKQKLACLLNFGRFKRLALVHCDQIMPFPWQNFSQDLSALEIINPLPSYPTKAGLYLSDNLFQFPLTYFGNLEVLVLQNVGAPICDVLFNLCNSGKSLKILKLHDQECAGLDRTYDFHRRQYHGQSTHLQCPMVKFLRKICPHVQELSIDMSKKYWMSGLDTKLQRASDSRSMPLEPLFEEMAQDSTWAISDILRSFPRLRFLKFVCRLDLDENLSRDILCYAQKVWSPTLETFSVAISTDIETTSRAHVAVDGDWKAAKFRREQLEWSVILNEEIGAAQIQRKVL